MAILYFVSQKVAARAIARVRWHSELDAKSGKVIFVPPSEQVILQFERFAYKELESDELADVLGDDAYATFAEWQLYDSYKLYEEEPSLPPWPFREAYFFTQSDNVAAAQEVFGKFTVENMRLDCKRDAREDKIRVRFYVNREQIVGLEKALREAELCGHCNESSLYICRDPDGPPK